MSPETVLSTTVKNYILPIFDDPIIPDVNTLSRQLIRFYNNLLPPKVPRGILVMHPQPDPSVKEVVRIFFEKYFSDNKVRRLLLGINPGRFGAGITGINFTAPRQLKQYCGIDHPWPDRTELSAEFIYGMIEEYGGAQKFYSDYFIGAISPLGFTKDGKNINYYDDKELLRAVTPFIIQSIRKLLKMGFHTDVCFCVGGEKNFRFLKTLNEDQGFFEKIIPLPHPRFIMQYRRKKKDEYIKDWLHIIRHH